MEEKIAFIHTSATLVPLFTDLASNSLPGVATFHIANDSLIKDVIASGCLTPDVAWRVAELVRQAEGSGATRILVTCSSIGAAVEASRLFVSVPVYRVDQAMAEKAVASGSRIGVIATLPTTLEPTRNLVERVAKTALKEIDVQSHLCEGAFEALMSGDPEAHDASVREGLFALMADCDVILLAQASMARVVDTIPAEECRVPILSSPALAMQWLAGQLDSDK
ncbi:MAG: aspartate/glutamate racemase family protein [Puniceicoccaceae bacterium]